MTESVTSLLERTSEAGHDHVRSERHVADGDGSRIKEVVRCYITAPRCSRDEEIANPCGVRMQLMERPDFVTVLVNMRETDQINCPLAGRFVKILPRLVSAVALWVLCCLQVIRAPAQSCTKCPTDAQSSAIGDAFDIYVVRNGLT